MSLHVIPVEGDMAVSQLIFLNTRSRHCTNLVANGPAGTIAKSALHIVLYNIIITIFRLCTFLEYK